MSSTNKTENFQLNSWVGSDIPSREDFVRDNNIIDEALNTHFSDTDIHIEASERDKWNSMYCIDKYFGDGAESQVVELQLDFEPTWGIVFSTSKPPSLVDIGNSANYNYFGVFTRYRAMPGISINGKNLTVSIDPDGYLNTEFASYNVLGDLYYVICFR